MSRILEALLRPLWRIERYFKDLSFHLQIERRRFLDEVWIHDKKNKKEKQ